MKSKYNKKAKRIVKFNPNHAYVNEAIGTFLENGGQIIKTYAKDGYERFASLVNTQDNADDYLRGC